MPVPSPAHGLESDSMSPTGVGGGQHRLAMWSSSVEPLSHIPDIEMVPMVRIELTCFSAAGFEAAVAADFTTPGLIGRCRGCRTRLWNANLAL